jgi:quercetin dioxygenase-like cupin family protein
MEIIRGREDGASSGQRTGTFTGVVFGDPVRSGDGVTIANIFFTPGARTFWHHHERGQILHVTTGSGLICSEGSEPQVLHVGDTVWVPPGERHWHGGSSETCMLHMAISLGTTTWLDEVTEDEYRSGR